MNKALIKGTIEDTDKAIAWLERVKFRVSVWTPENDIDEFLYRAEAAEFLGVSCRTVGLLTKQGVLKAYGEGRYKIYFRRECLQTLRDNSPWHKKPRPKRPGLISPHNRVNEKMIRTRSKNSHFSGDSPNLK